MYVKLLKEKQMKKGLKIAAIVVGVIILSSTYKCNFLGADNKQ